jgi:hypothetical protein
MVDPDQYVYLQNNFKWYMEQVVGLDRKLLKLTAEVWHILAINRNQIEKVLEKYQDWQDLKTAYNCTLLWEI